MPWLLAEQLSTALDVPVGAYWVRADRVEIGGRERNERVGYANPDFFRIFDEAEGGSPGTALFTASMARGPGPVIRIDSWSGRTIAATRSSLIDTFPDVSVWVPFDSLVGREPEETFDSVDLGSVTLVLRLDGRASAAAVVEAARTLLANHAPAAEAVPARPLVLLPLQAVLVGEPSYRGFGIGERASWACLALGFAALGVLGLHDAVLRQGEAAVRLVLGASWPQFFAAECKRSLAMAAGAAALAWPLVLLLRRQHPGTPSWLAWPTPTWILLVAWVASTTLVLALLRTLIAVRTPLTLAQRSHDRPAFLGAVAPALVTVAAVAYPMVGLGLATNAATTRLLGTDSGLKADRLWVFELNWSVPRTVPSWRPVQAVDAELRARGLAPVWMSRLLVPGATHRSSLFLGDGRRVLTADAAAPIHVGVSRGFATTLGRGLEAGRDVADELDCRTREAVVTRGLAEALWPRSHADALGSTLRFSRRDPEFRIVGVVDDVSVGRLDLRPPAIFSSLGCMSPSTVWLGVLANGHAPGRILDDLVERAAPYEVSRNGSLDRMVSESMAQEARLALAGDMMAAAGLASLVAVVGLIAAATAEARCRDIAIRRALGARPWVALEQAWRPIVRPVALGLGVGALAGYWGLEALRAAVELPWPSMSTIGLVGLGAIGGAVCLALWWVGRGALARPIGTVLRME